MLKLLLGNIRWTQTSPLTWALSSPRGNWESLNHLGLNVKKDSAFLDAHYVFSRTLFTLSHRYR